MCRIGGRLSTHEIPVKRKVPNLDVHLFLSAGYWSTRLRLFRYFHIDISTIDLDRRRVKRSKHKRDNYILFMFLLKPWGKGRPTTRSIHRRERVSANRSDLHHCINIHDIKRHRSPVVLAHMHERPTHDLRMVAATSTQRSEICRATTCESWIMYLSPYPYLVVAFNLFVCPNFSRGSLDASVPKMTRKDERRIRPLLHHPPSRPRRPRCPRRQARMKIDPRGYHLLPWPLRQFRPSFPLRTARPRP